jgi:hypothetical protein
MQVTQHITKSGLKYYMEDLILEKEIWIPLGMGYNVFIVSDLQEIGIQKGNNRYLLRVEKTDTWGKKVKTKFSTLEQLINYVNTKQTSLRKTRN